MKKHGKVRIWVMSDQRGMTMVEVVAAFCILLIGLGGLYKATVASGNMVNKAQEVQAQVDDVMNGYYQKTLTPETKEIKIRLVEKEKAEHTEGADLPEVSEMSAIVNDYANSKGYHIYELQPKEEEVKQP